MEENRVVIFGGSFNPPTIAHLVTLKAAVEDYHADKGLFVPSSNSYVTRKMSRCKAANTVYAENLRMAMLQSMCKDDERLNVNNIEYYMSRDARTYDTVCAIQNIYPEAKLAFIIGSDKLRILPKWYRITEFLTKFDMLVTSRKTDNIPELIANNEFLKNYASSFIPFSVPDDIANISSSKVRAYLHDKNPAVKTMITPEVYKLLQKAETKLCHF